jgi:hypothetical protein
MLQSYSFTGPRTLAAQGKFLLYQSANSPLVSQEINVFVNGRSIGTYSPGDSVNLPEGSNQWEIVPLAPTQSGKIIIGTGSVHRPQTAEIIDSAISRTLLGRNYYFTDYRTSAAGQYSLIGIYAGADTVALRRFNVMQGVGGVGYVYHGVGAPSAPSLTHQPHSKVSTQAPCSARMYAADVPSATIPVLAGVTFEAVPSSIQLYNAYAIYAPFGVPYPILMPGESIWFVCNTAATVAAIIADIEIL